MRQLYEFFEHQADIGIVGKGGTWEEAFAEAAKGMFAYMCDIGKVGNENRTKLEVQANDLDALLVEFLNELLFLKDKEETMYGSFEVKIDGDMLTCVATGSKFSEALGLKTEVKAATYAGLKHWEDGETKCIQCILDV